MAKESSLLTATKTTRKFLIYFTIFAIVVIVLNGIGNLFLNVTKNRSNAVTPVSEKKVFGELNNLTLSKNSIVIGSNSKPTFNIKAGQLPDSSGDVVNVYKVKAPKSDQAGLVKINDLAQKLKFAKQLEAETGNANKYSVQEGNRVLTFEFDNYKWTYFNPLVAPPNKFANFNPDRQKLIQLSKLINQLNIQRPLLDLSLTEVDYLTKRGNAFQSVNDPKQAEYAKFRIYKKLPKSTKPESQNQTDTQERTLAVDVKQTLDPANAKVIGVDTLSAPMEIIMTTTSSESLRLEDIYSLKFAEHDVESEIGSYKLISHAEAWKRASESKGALIKLLEDQLDPYQFARLSGQDVVLFNLDPALIEIAYLEPQVESGVPYFLPIYRLRGTARLGNSAQTDNATFEIIVNAL